jgi:hypothetical protein
MWRDARVARKMHHAACGEDSILGKPVFTTVIGTQISTTEHDVTAISQEGNRVAAESFTLYILSININIWNGMVTVQQ